MSVENKTPELLLELATMVNRMPLRSDGLWKRLRIAVTGEELDEFRRFFKIDNGREFIWAVRGVPLQLEVHPTDPAFCIESFAK
jgi:hypothetical protein